jgi:hypothetical protein
MLNTNSQRLVMQSVEGVVHHPVVRIADTRVDNNGVPFALPNVGGICYNVTLGDSVYGLAGDHIEPDVSIKNSTPQEDAALNFLACIGNKARVVTGDAKGRTGFVTGKHGGIEHVICYFDSETKFLLKHNDSILIESIGQGLKILDCTDVMVKNIAPELLDKVVADCHNNVLTVPVTAVAPAHLLGSGIGYLSSNSGDYDLQTADWGEITLHKLDKLRFGDIIAVTDSDTRYGRGYRKNSVTVGVVVHSDCRASGHGPGIVTILSGDRDTIKYTIDTNANIGVYMGIL